MLEDQSLNSIIRVKAVDKAGNEQVSNLIPEESMRTISRTTVYMVVSGFFLIILCLVFAFVTFCLLKKRKARKQEEGFQSETNVKDNVTTNEYEE